MSIRRKLAIASWSPPREGNIYGKLTLDCTEAKKYMEHVRKTSGQKVTITHLVGKALGEALAATPTLNGRIVCRRFVPFKKVNVAFLVALEDGKNLFKVRVDDVDKKSTSDIASELGEGAMKLRNKDDKQLKQTTSLLKIVPRFILPGLLWLQGYLASALGLQSTWLGMERFPFGSGIVTSVGMLGFDEGYAPPTPFARTPILVLVGAMKPRPMVVDGELVVRETVSITATVDHRFIDGYQLGHVAKVFRRVIEDPWSTDVEEP